MKIFIDKRLEITILLVVLLIGIFLRFHQLESVPGGLYADVAANGLDGLNVANGSDIRVLYPRNAGREGMFFWLLGGLQTFVTKHYAVIYLLTALIGIATLIIHYKVIRDFLGRKSALLGTFLLATSFYHVIYSRLGYRTILVPIFILGTFYGTRKMLLYSKRKEWAIASGFIFGLGIYTYLSYRTFMLAVFLSLAYFYYTYRQDWSIYRRNFKYFISTFLITIVPYIIAAIQDPNAAFGRSADVGGPGLLTGIFETLKIFGFEGEHEMQYNVPGMPLMSVFLATFLVVGLIFLFKRYWKRYEFAFIFLTIGSQLGIIAITDRVPHLLRAVGMTAFLYAVIAYGFIEFVKLISNKIVSEASFNLRYLAIALFGFLSLLYFAILPVQTFHNYFSFWAKQEGINRREFFTDYIALGEYLNNMPRYLDQVTVFSTYFPSEDLYWRDSYPLQTTNYILQDDTPDYNVEWFDTVESGDLREYVFLKLDDSRTMEKFLQTRRDYAFYDLVFYEKDPSEAVYSVYKKLSN
jgi:ABC-type multidrug transport system fused ATPase/permease subunit